MSVKSCNILTSDFKTAHTAITEMRFMTYGFHLGRTCEDYGQASACYPFRFPFLLVGNIKQISKMVKATIMCLIQFVILTWNNLVSPLNTKFVTEFYNWIFFGICHFFFFSFFNSVHCIIKVIPYIISLKNVIHFKSQQNQLLQKQSRRDFFFFCELKLCC